MSALAIAVPWPYVWAWKSRPIVGYWGTQALDVKNRSGMRCRVIARGAKNSAMVLFEDGLCVITSRNGLRKAKP